METAPVHDVLEVPIPRRKEERHDLKDASTHDNLLTTDADAEYTDPNQSLYA